VRSGSSNTAASGDFNRNGQMNLPGFIIVSHYRLTWKNSVTCYFENISGEERLTKMLFGLTVCSR
jgi:hypothetical protein